MALIEEFHVVATHYPMDPNDHQNIHEGQWCKLNSTGWAALHEGDTSRTLGVFGDNTTKSASDSDKATAFSDQITINSNGTRIFTQNRVSDDQGDEVLASNRITVYNGGGQFHTDQYETLDGATPITYTPGLGTYISGNARITTNTGSGTIVATIVVAPRAYPSGVPGTDTADGSLSLGTFLTFKLEV